MVLTPRSPTRRHSKPLRIEDWPADRLARAAERAEYVGSGEHKSYTNPVTDEPPGHRSDAAKCERHPAADWAGFTNSLRAAIAAGCVCGADGEMPRHVWGFHGARMFQARRRTDPPGTRYKGWWIEAEERPEDPLGRLDALANTVARDE